MGSWFAGVAANLSRWDMTLNDALNQIIDDGIEAARADYSKPRDTLRRDGAIAGLEVRGVPSRNTGTGVVGRPRSSGSLTC
jgi:hypothetical protein